MVDTYAAYVRDLAGKCLSYLRTLNREWRESDVREFIRAQDSPPFTLTEFTVCEVCDFIAEYADLS